VFIHRDGKNCRGIRSTRRREPVWKTGRRVSLAHSPQFLGVVRRSTGRRYRDAWPKVPPRGATHCHRKWNENDLDPRDVSISRSRCHPPSRRSSPGGITKERDRISSSSLRQIIVGPARAERGGFECSDLSPLAGSDAQIGTSFVTSIAALELVKVEDLAEAKL
jgi:hypothetical protein